MTSLSTLFVNELRFDNRFFLLNEHTTTIIDVALYKVEITIIIRWFLYSRDLVFAIDYV